MSLGQVAKQIEASQNKHDSFFILVYNKPSCDLVCNE
jgi:hypothetical protein